MVTKVSGCWPPPPDQWKGSRAGRKAGTECGRLSMLPPREDLTVESTSSAANQAAFREEVWKAALKYTACLCGVPGELIRKRPTYRKVVQRQRSPDGTGHQLTTVGARVEQVGEKPWWRAVAMMVVVEFGATQPLGW